MIKALDTDKLMENLDWMIQAHHMNGDAANSTDRSVLATLLAIRWLVENSRVVTTATELSGVPLDAVKTHSTNRGDRSCAVVPPGGMKEKCRSEVAPLISSPGILTNPPQPTCRGSDEAPSASRECAMPAAIPWPHKPSPAGGDRTNREPGTFSETTRPRDHRTTGTQATEQ